MAHIDEIHKETLLLLDITVYTFYNYSPDYHNIILHFILYIVLYSYFIIAAAVLVVVLVHMTITKLNFMMKIKLTSVTQHLALGC